jgi:hypothetical protein
MHLHGPNRVIKFLYAPAPPPPHHSMGPETSLVRFLRIKPPMLPWFIQPCAQCFGCVHIHYLGEWEGVGPWVFGHSHIGLMPFHRAQKTLDIQGPTPSHLPLYWICCINQGAWIANSSSYLHGPRYVLVRFYFILNFENALEANWIW